MTDTLEDLLATTLRGAADSLDASPDVDATLATGRRRLRHRRVAIGAAALVAVVAIPATGLALSQRLGPQGPPPPMAVPAPTVTLSGDQIEFHSNERPRSDATDPTAITVAWTPTSAGAGRVSATYRTADGRAQDFGGDCTVPCFIVGPPRTGYGLIITPEEATSDSTIGGEGESSESRTAAPLPGTGLGVKAQRFARVTAPATVTGVLYLTSTGAFGPDNRPLPGHRFPASFAGQSPTLLYASEPLDLIGMESGGALGETYLSAGSRGIIFNEPPDSILSHGQLSSWFWTAAGILPVGARDVRFETTSDAGAPAVQIDRSQLVAGGNLFVATWKRPPAKFAVTAVSFTDASGKRVTLKA